LVVYRRAPWGFAPGGAPVFRVDGAPGAATKGDTVLALAGTSEVGRAPAADDGSFSVALDASDRESIDLAIVDEAGNASAPAAVANVEWTATMAGKKSGSAAENPTTLITTPLLL